MKKDIVKNLGKQSTYIICKGGLNKEVKETNKTNTITKIFYILK